MSEAPVSSAPAYPVKVLREQIVALEAALSVCLADPGHKPVHRLRTATRRVEAQLLLLALVPGLPEHREEAGALLRSLRKLRRAGGKVRDLDVHRELLDDLAESNEPSREQITPEESSPERTEAEVLPPEDTFPPEAAAPTHEPAADVQTLHEAAGKLRDHLKRKREKAAHKLVAMLTKRQSKAVAAAEALLATLEPAADLALLPSDLLRDADAVLTRDGLLAGGEVSRLSDDQLHTVRKAAKAARYLAETLPEDESLTEAARRFEALQESGGQWHDALELAHQARQFFGKDHQLTVFYKQDRNRKLAAYRQALAAQTESPNTPAKPKRRPATKKRPASGSK